MKKLILMFLFLAFASGASALTQLTSCGTLSTAGETYVLQNDVQSDGTCFTISASNIVLNLNKKTVTFGLNPPWVTGCTMSYLVSTGYVCTFGVRIAGGVQNAKITNGTIIQGGNLLSYSEAVLINGNSGHEISFLNITTYANDSSVINSEGGSDLKIHDNYIYSTASYVTNRMQGVAGIDISGSPGNVTVYNNIIINVPQWGIRLTGESLTSQPKGGMFVYNNYVRQTGVVSNGYGVGIHGLNSGIYNNTIVPINGRGIHVTRNNVSIHDNFVNVTEIANAEYPNGLPAHGIKLEDYYANGEVYNNKVYSYANPISGSADPLDVSLYANSNVSIFNNTFFAYFPTGLSGTRDNYGTGAHLYDYSTDNSGITLYNNTFISNHLGVYMRKAGGFRFINNTFILSNPTGAEPYFIFYWEGPAQNYIFLNNNLVGFQYKDDYIRTADTMNYSVQWYLTIRVVDTFGASLANANVIVRDRFGNTRTGSTNAQGMLMLPLGEYDRNMAGGIITDTLYNPYNISVTYGSSTQSRNTTLNISKTELFTFSTSNCPLLYDDTPCNCFTGTELGNAINAWYADQITINVLMQHIKQWKSQTGC